MPSNSCASGRYSTLAALTILVVCYVLATLVCVLLLPELWAYSAILVSTGIACLAAVVGLAWTGRRASGPDRRWRLLLAATAGGSLLLTAATIGAGFGKPPTAATDFRPVYSLFLLFYLPALIGLLSFPADPPPLPRGLGDQNGPAQAGRGRHWYAITALDSALVVGSLTLLVWSIVFAPLLRTVNVDPTRFLSALSNLIGEALLLVTVVLVGVLRRPHSLLALTLLGTGWLTLAMSSVAAVLEVATPQEGINTTLWLGFPVGWLLMLLAAFVPMPLAARPIRATASDTPGSRAASFVHAPVLRAALPYLAAGLACVVALGQLAAGLDLDRFEMYVLFILLLMLVVRQMMSLGEKTHLLDLVESSRRQLRHQAFHDPLTGLANRALFAERLRGALDRQGTDGRPFALLFCDLDNFKGINDTLGHAVGDELLQLTASRLRGATCATDTVARLGGDEFVVLLEGAIGDPRALCHRLVATARAPCVLAGRELPVGASFGMVHVDPAKIATDTSPVTADSLLRDADTAMYAAKRQGKGRLVVHQAGLRAPEAPTTIRGDLALALRGEQEAGTLHVEYRPVVELRSGRPAAVEAVPSWAHPRLGTVVAERLRGMAVEADLVTQLDQYVVARAGHDLARRASEIGDPWRVFVVVSTDRIISDPAATEELARLAIAGGAQADSLVMFLTGLGRAASPEPTDALLARLAASGLRLAVADADGGYRSLAALTSQRIEAVRLDPGLADTAADQDPDSPAAAARGAVLCMAHRRGLTVVAPGIRDHGQARRLAAAGCHLGLGPIYPTRDAIRPGRASGGPRPRRPGVRRLATPTDG
ncbi:diguanylate cyclase [Frankia sp. CNm7]|uniref:Diguanylate cyclase n=1 Tax=Frankia nepalensis TaxID=1836974 RepID=A0A937RQE6_9ACTN|nr:diguanylate cyclase [Frankia nepalensis]MBL7494965.1 diguanylate cyclase [Frankia nepalensis]MBL7514588.1 diguanylate cyclase [Frankia nepalensis]MBL7523824.1 diguanylate cyclase [Frankia nepalensis]MBL7633085.1 diguanylate cyclase [Frankia nepalensis]